MAGITWQKVGRVSPLTAALGWQDCTTRVCSERATPRGGR